MPTLIEPDRSEKFQKKRHETLFRVGLILLGVLIGSFLAPLFKKNSTPTSKRNVQVRLNSSDYTFINPLLVCNISENRELRELNELKKTVSDFIDINIASNKVEKLSVYLRDADTGKGFGINEDEKFSPASLLKVPTMMGILKHAEQLPAVLKKTVYFDGSFNDNSYESIQSKNVIVPGREYTVEALLASMVGKSDNNATRLLHEIVDDETINDVYRDLGIPIPKISIDTDFMSAKTYSFFFRVLYNATYLTRDFSEKALSYLSDAEFSQGISALTPPNVKVAHKFGERELFDVGTKSITSHELHDCGIIYSPSRPYFLCIMTKGKEIKQLASIISSISETVYNGITATSTRIETK